MGSAQPTGQRARVMSAAMALLRARCAESSICPSDGARVVGGPQWRSLVPIVGDAAAALAATGIVEVTQDGEPVAVTSASGPVRIRCGPRFA